MKWEQSGWEGVSATAGGKPGECVVRNTGEKSVDNRETLLRPRDMGTRSLAFAWRFPVSRGTVLWCVGTWWEDRNCRQPSPGPEGEKRNGHWGRGQSTIDAVTWGEGPVACAGAATFHPQQEQREAKVGPAWERGAALPRVGLRKACWVQDKGSLH